MLFQTLVAFLSSSVKYLIGSALCLGMFSNPLMGFFVSSAGAIMGIFVFTYGGMWIEEKFKKRFMSKGKHFNKRTRMLIRLKHSGGLPLIALLTPIFLSIPIGCILATTFVHSREKIAIYMTASVFIWGIIIFGTQWLFDLDLTQILRSW